VFSSACRDFEPYSRSQGARISSCRNLRSVSLVSWPRLRSSLAQALVIPLRLAISASAKAADASPPGNRRPVFHAPTARSRFAGSAASPIPPRLRRLPFQEQRWQTPFAVLRGRNQKEEQKRRNWPLINRVPGRSRGPVRITRPMRFGGVCGCRAGNGSRPQRPPQNAGESSGKSILTSCKKKCFH